MSDSDVFTSAGPKFEADLQSDRFDRYVMFTYGGDPGLFSLAFDPADTVVICGPSDTTEEVHEADTDLSITTRSVQSHAKLYLMWGADEIVCWLGSFNFTYSGIYKNVEWAARFSGSLDHDPTPDDLLDGRVNTEITESWQIQQALELVASTSTGEDTADADALLQNTRYPYVLVHSHRSNTLKRALQHELSDASDAVSITYYAPFVNARGIELFIETLAPAVSADKIHLSVRTCRLEGISSQDGGLNSTQVSKLKEMLAGFEYQVRAPGNQGDLLRDGRELRAGFAHQKMVALSYRDSEGDDQLVSLLTSANLTKNAWQHDSGNFEIGLLLRDDTYNDRLHELLGLQLSHCYQRPRDEELDAVTDTDSNKASFQEIWLEDLISDRLALTDSALTIAWDEALPKLESITATLYYRNVLDGSRSPESITLESSKEGFASAIPALSEQPDHVIDFIRFEISTAFRPPERRLTGAGIERLDRGELDLSEYSGETLICDRTEVPLDEFDADTTTAEEIWHRSESPEARTITLVHELKSQPHLTDAFIQDVSTGTLEGERIGGIAYLDIEVDSAITPQHDQLTLRQPDGIPVEYLGYKRTDACRLRYFFDASTGGTQVELIPAPPLDRYYHRQVETRELPQPTEPTAEAIRRFASSQLSAHPKGDVPAIDDETPIVFRAETDTIPQNVSLDVHWGSRGYDRFGVVSPLEDPVPPQDAHQQIWFRGAASLQTTDSELTVLTRSGNLTVAEQPFVSRFSPRVDLLPTHLDLHNLSNYQVMAWLVFERADMLKPSTHDTSRHLGVTITESGETCAPVRFQVLEDGELLCIPLLGKHRDQTLQFEFEMELLGSRPEFPYYAEKRQEFSVTIEASESALTLSWDSGSETIHHRSEASPVQLEPLTERVDLEELASGLQSYDPFELHSRDKLDMHAEELAVLHFNT